jgi:hypothetical protein
MLYHPMISVRSRRDLYLRALAVRQRKRACEKDCSAGEQQRAFLQLAISAVYFCWQKAVGAVFTKSSIYRTTTSTIASGNAARSPVPADFPRDVRKITAPRAA